jgi:nitroreductase
MNYSLSAVEALGGESVDVIDAMRRRRMHREYDDRPVPRTVLAYLAWAAGRAQCARPGVRVLVVVDDPDLMQTARDVLPGFTNNAPAMIVIASKLDQLERAIGRRGVEHTSRLDSGAAAAHLALAAQSVGVGVCTVTSWSETAVRSLVDLPETVRPDVTVAIGYPSRTSTPAPKGTHDPSVSHNTFRLGFPAEPR